MKVTSKSHPQIVKIAKHAFPDYSGRKIYTEAVQSVDTSEDSGALGGGGTYAQYRFVRLDNGAILNVPSVRMGESWDKRTATIPAGAACVKHSHFCGHDCGLTVYVSDQNMVTAAA